MNGNTLMKNQTINVAILFGRICKSARTEKLSIFAQSKSNVMF